MNKDDQKRLAEAFRKMHRGPRIAAAAECMGCDERPHVRGRRFRRGATTSGGVAWALGYPDGEKTPWDEVVAATRRIVRRCKCRLPRTSKPATAQPRPSGAQRCRDHRSRRRRHQSRGQQLRSGIRSVRSRTPSRASARPARRRASKRTIVVNARVDLYLEHVHDDETRFAKRCSAPRPMPPPAPIASFRSALTDPKTFASSSRR